MLKMSATKDSPEKIKCDVLALGLFEDSSLASVTKLDTVLAKKITKALDQKRFKAKEQEVLEFDAPAEFTAEKILVVGLGKKSEFTVDDARLAVATVIRRTKKLKYSSLGFFSIKQTQLDHNEIFYAQLEGAFLGAYTFAGIHKKNEEKAIIKEFIIIDDEVKTPGKSLLKKAQIVATAIEEAKDLINLPANVVTPAYLVKQAQKVAKVNSKIKLKVISYLEAQKMGMGGFCSVAQGATEPAKFIVLEYQLGAKETIGLVGKGLTFDSGGISIKPSKGMGEMKTDMSGAATVLSAFKALVELGVKKNLVAVIPATENMPSGQAYKPGDVIKMLSGLTVEINSTDAEGRLILADALCYAQKRGAKKIINYATLTGACLVALGQTRTGIMSNDDGFVRDYLAAAQKSGEKHWQLPLDKEYGELLKSTVADTLNNSESRYAGTITAGKFLEKFIEKETKWIHCDIAGTAYLSKPQRYLDKQATGVAIRTLVELFY